MCPMRGAWATAACVKAPIFQPVSAEVYIGRSSHFGSLLTPVRFAVETGHYVHVECWSCCVSSRCLHLRIRRESTLLCRCSFSLCWCDSLCDSPDNVCSMAQVMTKLSHHPHSLATFSQVLSPTQLGPAHSLENEYGNGRHAWLKHFSSWLGC